MAPVARKEARIVNGNPTTASEYPFIALLKYYNPIRDENFYSCCGGAIIQKDPAIILTAAHCLDGTVFSFTDIWVDLGADVSDNGPFNPNKTNQFKVEKMLKHPQYRRITLQQYNNDVGLLYLNVNLSDYSDVFPFETVTITKDADADSYCCESEDELQVIGYGLEREDGPRTETLEYTDLMYVDSETCSAKMNGITDGMICAWAFRTDACQCDSGGPLVKTGSNEQVGVVSWGYGCATDDPGVYTRVGYYYDWITDNMDEMPSHGGAVDYIIGKILAGILGGALVALIVIIGLWCTNMRKKTKKDSDVNTTQTQQQYVEVDVEEDTDNEPLETNQGVKTTQ